MKILTLIFKDGPEIVPAFTSEDESQKGPSSSSVRYYPIDYMPMLLNMDKPIVINPFGECKFVLEQNLIKEVLLPIVKENFAKKDSNTPIKNENDELIGAIIEDKYVIIKEIGRGTLSRIYLCIDKHINKVWVAKVIDKKDKYYNSATYDSVMQETEMIRHLDHSGIPKIVELIETERYIFIIREYIEGENLFTIVNQFSAQPVDKVIDWAKQVFKILQYLHTLTPPHIHRDIKPMNMILTPVGEIKLIDFGIMRTYREGANADTCLLGTKGYAVPEQYGGMSQSDARTDIFGLGMTMFYLVTGVDSIKPPYEIKPIRQINPAVPKRLEEIICKCIEPNPDKRYLSAEALLSVLSGEKDPNAPKGIFGKLFRK